MRLAAFGDIHSNHIALQACIAQAERVGIDGVLFLGDYVSDCACPQKTMSLIRQIAASYPAWFIRGNREEYMLKHAENPDDGWRRNSQTGSLLYTYENLTKMDLAWFESLPISLRVDIEGTAPFEICHGAMDRTRVMLLPGNAEADAAFDSTRTNLMVCAHTHHQFIARRAGKTIVNGGTLGVPNGKIGAEYAILEWKDGRWTPELMRAEYDTQAVAREFRESGFMDAARVWARIVIHAICTGQDTTKQCVTLVDRYSGETGLPFGEEALWQRAAEALGV